MAKKQSKRNKPIAPGMTVSATPRVMSAVPPQTRITDADVQGATTKETATRREGTVTSKKIDGIAQRGRTRGRII
jgi:hypothetical protein